MRDAPKLFARFGTGNQRLLLEVTLQQDAHSLGRLALTTAAELLHFCAQTDPWTIDDLGRPQNPVLQQLADRGIDSIAIDTNYLVEKAQLLYEIVVADVAAGGQRVLWTTGMMKNRFRTVDLNAHRQIIADALTAMQEYKTKVVERGHQDHSPSWGNATRFNQMDWTDHNQAFLEMALMGSKN